MGRRKKKHPSKNTLVLAIVFFAFVGSLLVVSLLLKIGVLVRSSHFDGIHRFTIAISSKASQEKDSKLTQIISFSPKNGTIQQLTLSENIPLFAMERFLEIPIDGTVLFRDKSRSGKNEIDDTAKLLLMDYSSLTTNLTVLDVFRLWLFEHTVSPHFVTARIFTKDPLISLETQLDRLTQKLFSDEEIALEKESIAVVNGTQIGGFGTRFSRLITNMGGNVVSLTTSDSQIKKTTLTYREKHSYTLLKLEKLLGVSATKSKITDLANIVVTLGRDKSTTFAF